MNLFLPRIDFIVGNPNDVLEQTSDLNEYTSVHPRVYEEWELTEDDIELWRELDE